MSKLILLRHGQALFANDNYDKLSDIGRAQAIETGKQLHDKPEIFTHVLKGPRTRHAETVDLILTSCDFKGFIETDSRLDEFAEGNEIYAAAAKARQLSVTEMQNKPLPEQVNAYIQGCRDWAESRIVIEGRMPIEHFFNQAKNWLKDIMKHTEVSGGLTLLAVTSAGVIAAVVCIVLGLEKSSWHKLLTVIENCSITEILFTADRCSLLNFNWQMLPKQISTKL